MTMKRPIPHDRRSQPGVAVFRPDLHWLRLRQGQGSPGNGIGVDELLPALCFAARTAVRNHVEDALRGTQQPPFLVATTLGTMSAFALALMSGRIIGRLSFREA